MPIGALAVETGVRVPTIRYYEQIGLLPAPERSTGNQRLYGRAAQERLAWLDGLIAGRRYVCGDRFSLADIMLFAFLELSVEVDGGMSPASEAGVWIREPMDEFSDGAKVKSGPENSVHDASWEP